jgi:putative membrane protein insertion efficiency factor
VARQALDGHASFLIGVAGMRRSVRFAFAFLLVVGTAVVHDGRSGVADRWSTRAAVSGIHVYQAIVSPVLAATGTRCRFIPTCSHYAEAAIEQDGIVRGGWRTGKRIVRCGPWTPLGTVDPP